MKEQKRSPRKFGLPPIVVTERELESSEEEKEDGTQEKEPPKPLKPD
jgi:hypothetical protein